VATLTDKKAQTQNGPLAGKKALVLGGSRGIGAAIVERLAAELGDSVRLRSVVLRVEHGKSGAVVQTATERLSARHVIVAIPPPLVAQLEFDPPLGSQRWNALQKSTMGHVIKYNLVYRSPFWKRSMTLRTWPTVSRSA